LNAEASIAHHYVERALTLGHDEAGLIRRQDVAHGAAVGEHEPEQHIGLTGGDPLHSNRLPHEPTRAVNLPVRHDTDVFEARLRLSARAAALTHDRHEATAGDTDGGLLPAHQGMAGRGLTHLKE